MPGSFLHQKRVKFPFDELKIISDLTSSPSVLPQKHRTYGKGRNGSCIDWKCTVVVFFLVYDAKKISF